LSKRLPNEKERSELNTLLKVENYVESKAEVKGFVKLNVELVYGPQKRLSLPNLRRRLGLCCDSC